MTNTIKKLSLVIFALIFLNACGNHEKIKQNPSVNTLDTVPGVDFQQVLEGVLKPDCFECHSATYGDYTVVAAQAPRILNAVLLGTMPKNASPLSDEKKALLQAWVNDGAPEFAGKVSLAIPLAPTFKSLFANVIGPKCVACHTGRSNSPAPPDVNLSSYEEIIKSNEKYALVFGDGFLSQELGADSELIYLITDPVEPMPPIQIPGNPDYNANPIPKLNDDEVKALTDWILKGFPND